MIRYLFLIIFIGLCLSVQGQDTLIPAGRSVHAAAFDKKRNEMLVFGGQRHYGNTSKVPPVGNQLWSWNEHGWKVRSRQGPSLRDDAKMVYHEKNKKVYMYGGRIGGNVSDEFWEWDGKLWNLIPMSLSPGKRLHFNMAYDVYRERIVLFAGVKKDSQNKSSFTNDVWEWDGQSWQMIPVSNAPSPRFAFSMVYSTALKKTLIIGGVNQKDESFPEIWSWDGSKFELIDSSMPLVETGMSNVSCLDKAGKIKLLLFGRIRIQKNEDLKNREVARAGTWLWDGGKWKMLQLTINPSMRELHSMVYDSANDRVILFGGNGRADSNFDSPNDVWIFKDEKWTAK